MNRYILLWFEGPLQSWGFNSKFGRRETLSFPTKSAVYGMLLSAMGKTGAQKEFLETIASFKQTVISYTNVNERKLDGKFFWLPTLSSKILIDYHMVGSGYNSEDSWQDLFIPKKRDGSTPNTGGAKITYRYYLQDAKFAIIQEMDSAIVEDISDALNAPVFEICLGRKSCIPTDFINRGIFNTFEEALEQANSIKNAKNLIEQFRIIEEEGKGEEFVIEDVPIQFGQFKKYKNRIVSLVDYE